MHFAALSHSLAHFFLHLPHAQAAGSAALLGHGLHGVHRAEPHDVVDVYFIACQPVLAAVGVEHTSQAVALLTEEVEERTVLAKFVSVGGIVERAVVVAGQHDEAAAYELAQAVAAFHISLFVEKHVEWYFLEKRSG